MGVAFNNNNNVAWLRFFAFFSVGFGEKNALHVQIVGPVLGGAAVRGAGMEDKQEHGGDREGGGQVSGHLGGRVARECPGGLR